MDDSGTPRAELVYDWVKRQIREGKVQPGTRLREAQLAKELGISRTPVREAVNRLLSEGQLVLNSSRGFSVAKLDRQQVLELYALREFLEAASARFAAQHASEPEIEALHDLLAQSLEIADDPPELAILNKRFHIAISSAGHNRYSDQALVRMADSLGLIPGTTFTMEGRAAAVFEEHTAILDAMESRDPDAAETAARYHIHHAGKARLKMLFVQL